MSKTKEELDALKEEVETVNEKLAELTPEEIAQVNGGVDTTSSLLWCRTCNAKVHYAAGPTIDGMPYVVCNNCGGLIPNAF